MNKFLTGVLAGVVGAAVIAVPTVMANDADVNAVDEAEELVVEVASGTHELRFVPLRRCVVADTRKAASNGAGGPVEPGAERALQVRSETDSLAAQGGSTKGCGVPEYAAAAEVTLTAIRPAKRGAVRMGGRSSDKTPPALTYTKNSRPSATSTVRLCATACTGDVHYQVTGGSTHLMVQVSGYWVEPIYATLDGTGAVTSSSRLASVTKVEVGAHALFFDRDVVGCALSATIGRVSAFTPDNATVVVARRLDSVTGVFVQTRDPDGTFADHGFQLSIEC